MRGVAFTVAMRWVNKLIGLVSTLILARLLVPEDFGIVAMAFMAMALLSAFMDLGVNVALVRNPQVTDAHYHSAWTLRLMQAGLIAALLLVGAPWAGDYFKDPRVEPVLMLMALNMAIGSLENIGIVSFQKELQFGREFRFHLINRLFNFVVTVGLALALRSYWALVIAGTVGAVFSVAHSYLAHPMRPRLSTEKLREIFAVSQWMLVQNIGGYLDNNLHKLLVGRRDDTATMGAYSVAADLAAMPSSELLQPLNRVLFPAFAAMKHDLEQLKRAFLMAQSVQVMVAVPAAMLLSLLAPEVVGLLLGPKWVSAVPLLQTLALGYALLAIQSSAWYVSITLGQERRCAAVSWSQILLFVLIVWLALPGAQAEEIAGVRVGVSAFGLGLQLWITAQALGNLHLRELIAGLWRSAVAIALTVLCLSWAAWPQLHVALSLTLKSAIAVACYGISIWLLWLASGRPDGAERFIGNQITRIVGSMSRSAPQDARP